MAYASTYANFFLGLWEQALVFMESLEGFASHILLWVHFIVDIFILWQGPKESFETFMGHLKANDMFFKSEIQRDSINFLDLKITYKGGWWHH